VYECATLYDVDVDVDVDRNGFPCTRDEDGNILEEA